MRARGGFHCFSVLVPLCCVALLLMQITNTECARRAGAGNNGDESGEKRSQTWAGALEPKSAEQHRKETVQKTATLVRRSSGTGGGSGGGGGGGFGTSPTHKLHGRRRQKLPHSLAMDQLTKYYSCIKRSHALERHIYQTYIVKPGQRLLLRCYQCFKPGTTNEVKEKVKWQHLQEQGTVLSRVQSKGNYEITKKRDLVIKAMHSEDDGYYYCLNGNQYEAIHQVTTVTNRKFHTVSENSTKSFLTLVNLTSNNLKLFSSWSHWSKCSQCGKSGFRRKIGLCSVMKINETAPVKPVDIYMFYYFDGSLSCLSTALPTEIRALPAIESRQDEALYSKCHVPCPKKPARTIIKDQTGKVVEVVMPGYLSMQQKRRTAPPVVRGVIYTAEASDVIISCHTDETMVRWQNGSTPLRHFIESRKTKGRVFIDVTNSLHIRDIRFSDTSVYSCWKQNLLLHTMKLVVTEAMMDMEDPYIVYIMTGITIFGLLMTSCCMYSGRHRGMVR